MEGVHLGAEISSLRIGEAVFHSGPRTVSNQSNTQSQRENLTMERRYELKVLSLMQPRVES